MSLSQNIINSIKNVLSCEATPIDLHAPSFSNLEKEYVLDCIESTRVSSSGEYLTRFEEELADYCHSKYAICCVNATAGLHIAQIALGVGFGDEVFVPAFSFVATANAVCHAGAIPHFVDVNNDDLGIDPLLLEDYLSEIIEIKEGSPYNKNTGRKIAALIVVHCFGYPAQIDKILAVCSKYRIPIIEDAAEGLGTFYKGRHVGSFGELSAISFNGNKIITTGGGGVILTNNKELAQHVRHITTTAKQPHPWEYNHDALGYNYRLPNINAALGLAQLKRLPTFLKNKLELHKKYLKAFHGSADLRMLTDTSNFQSNHWLNTIILSPENESVKEDILQEAHEEKIFLRPIWKMLSKQAHLRNFPRMLLSNAEALENRIINLPSSSFLIK
jgi:perosamine synthetase